MINNQIASLYKNVTKISILDAKKVFYNLQSVLQKNDIYFDDEDALVIIPLPEDIKYPSSAKLTDGGQVFNYRVDITINDQNAYNEKKIVGFHNKKTIVVLHYPQGKTIIGCNEMPLQFLYEDDNTSNPTGNNGYSIQLIGTTYYSKVNL